MVETLLPGLIVGPIVVAVVVLIGGLRWPRSGWSLTAVTSVGLLVFTAVVSRTVLVRGRMTNELAGFPRRYGIELVADELTIALLVLIALVGSGALVFARIAGPRGNTFYAGYLLLIGGLHGVVLTGDLFNLFVFLEIVGLTTYALVAANRSASAAYASLQYLFLGTIGASVYLVGVGYVFLATGTLNMTELQPALAEAGHTSRLVQAAYALVFVGLALKIAQFPLHTWQPDAYQRAPDAVTIVMSALVSTAAAYALIRITFTVFTVDFLAVNALVTDFMSVIAGISIVFGSAMAAVQSDLKRIFAYSSIAQFGMIVAAIAIATEAALLGGIIHLVGHGLVKGALFLAVGMIGLQTGARHLDDIAGLGTQLPVIAAGLSVLGLVLVGVPPSVGFIGKWYIAVGAIEAGDWGIAVVILVSTLLTLAYVARIIERMYFPAEERLATVHRERSLVADGPSLASVGGEATDSRGPTPGMAIVLVVAVAISVLLGFGGIAFADLFEPVIGGFLG